MSTHSSWNDDEHEAHDPTMPEQEADPHDCTKNEQLAEDICQHFVDVMYEHHMSIEDGLAVLFLITANALAHIRKTLYHHTDIAYPDTRLWHFVNRLTHTLSHAPIGAAPGSDDWLDHRHGDADPED